jgi:hypothetical protein
VGSSERRARLRILAHVGFGAVGLLALGLLVRAAGPASLAAELRRTAPYLPALLGIEAVRIGAEAACTGFLCARLGRRVPPVVLARVHLVAFAVSATMPAGRAASEATKAAMLSSRLGVPEAAAVGATNQALALLASGLCCAAAFFAAWSATGRSAITAAMAVFVAVTFAAFGAIQLAGRRKELAGLLLERFARFGRATASFQHAVSGLPVLPWPSIGAMTANRLLQAVELGIVIHALGATFHPARALLAEGVLIAGGSVGDFIPGQVGAMDGAFALAAPALGMTVADGIATAVVAHFLQLCWTVIGTTAPLWWKAPPPEPLRG